MPPKKRPKLANLAGLKNVTDSSLAAILAQLEHAGSLQGFGATSRRAIARSVEADLGRESIYGPLLQTVQLPLVDGASSKHFDWTYVHPGVALSWLAQRSEAFTKVLEECLARSPSTFDQKWHIIMYADEACPGNLLKVDNTRKSVCVYWAFEEQGHELLSRENNWFLAGILRSSIIKRVAGGLSCVFKCLMEVFFGASFNFALTGVTVHTTNHVQHIFADLGTLVADEAAIKSIWSVKGSSGWKPCLLCKNVVGTRFGIAEHSSYFVGQGCADFQKFDLHSDHSLWECVDALTAASESNCSKKDMEDLEKTLGVTFNPQGVLWHKSLRQFVKPISCTMWDFCHVWLVAGIVQVELHLFLGAAKRELGLKFQDMDTYLKLWRWPSAVNDVPRNTFSSQRAQACEDSFKAGASELLNVYAVLRHFVSTVLAPQGKLACEISSLLALFKVLDGWHLVQNQPSKTPLWQAAISDHLVKFQAAYSADGDPTKPKHHASMHFQHLQKKNRGHLWACFVHERKHKQFKKFASATTCMVTFERSVTSDLLNHQVNTLDEHLQTGSFLVPPLGVVPQFPGHTVSKKATCRGITSASGDYVFYNIVGGTAVAWVRLHLRAADGEHWVLVDALRELQGAPQYIYTFQGKAELIALDSIMGACVWSTWGADAAEVVVLPPSQVAWSQI